MDWKEKYASKIVTADEAVAGVQSGDKIILGDWLGEPPALIRALVKRAPELRNVNIIHGISPGPGDHLKPEVAESFKHTAVFIGTTARKMMAEGRCEYIGGTCFHQWPKMLDSNELTDDHWAFIQLSEPDENGMCGFANDCTYNEPATRNAKKVVAQINMQAPRIGGTKISLDKIDYIVCEDEPVYTIPNAPFTDTDLKIGQYIADMVEDGATVQFGLGALPNAVGMCLKNKKDLGVHSETLTEAMMELVKAGVITNKCKTLNPGICIGGQAAGSQEFFEFLNNNPMFELRPIDYVNDPYIIGQNYKQTSINTCIEVDLLGQVNSEVINGKQYSGIGGQLDHVRGAQLSEGGKSIIALHSTTKNDTVSKIVPTLAPGTVVTVSRYDVHYIVTEYGVADLKYKTLKQRAEALINIAHPNFREQLREEAKKMNLI